MELVAGLGDRMNAYNIFVGMPEKTIRNIHSFFFFGGGVYY